MEYRRHLRIPGFPLHPKTKLSSDGATDAERRIYIALAQGRPQLAAEPLSAMIASKRHRHEGLIAEAWSNLVSGDPTKAMALADPPPLLHAALAMTQGSPTALNAIEAALRSDSITDSAAPALMVLRQHGVLDELGSRMSADALGVTKLIRMRQLTLDFGLLHEQMSLSGALERAADHLK